MLRRKGRGFTLIELLIVVAIIAILALIAVPNFLEAQTRAKVSRVRNDLRQLDLAAKALQVDKGHDAMLVDFWDDDEEWGKLRVHEVFGDIGGQWPWGNYENYRRQVDVLAPLTSPIAYITSLPWEPFIPPAWRNKPGGHSEVAGKEGNESYMYMDDDTFYNLQRGPHTMAGWNLYLWTGGPGQVPALKMAEWWFIGYGPVIAPREQPQEGVRDAYAYDPTNGTVSIGCIFRRSGGEQY